MKIITREHKGGFAWYLWKEPRYAYGMEYYKGNIALYWKEQELQIRFRFIRWVVLPRVQIFRHTF